MLFIVSLVVEGGGVGACMPPGGFKIQFDDSLTSTYEYPSETSLLDMKGDDDTDNGTDTNGGIVPAAFADNGLLSHTNKLLSSVPLGKCPTPSHPAPNHDPCFPTNPSRVLHHDPIPILG
uniref:Uncharacterized protein n=1 Tax=Anopheles maculatus TaxID=74869 RepID=A0A182SD19_9DIPT